MKNVIIALAVIIFCVLIGSALGNEWGGFIVGVILAITLTKRIWKADTSRNRYG